MSFPPEQSGWRLRAVPGGVRVLLTLLLLNGLVLALDIPRHAGPGPGWLAWEAVVLAGLFAVLPLATARVLARVVAASLLALIVLALFDALARVSLARPLNVYVDIGLLDAVFRLLTGNLPTFGVILAVAALLAVIGLAVWSLARLLARPVVPRGAGFVLLGAGLAGLAGHATGVEPPRTAAPAVVLVTEQVDGMREARREDRALAHRLDEDPRLAEPRPLEGLAGIDVVVGLIESYGVSALEIPRYAEVIEPTLEDLQEDLAARDLHVVTGVMKAPIAGGQSWLAHATLLSGVAVRHAGQYRRLQERERATLVQDFAATGHHTAMLAPAITLDWPEGRWFGWDRILDRDGMDYRGPPFFWVTMPDEFTWWRFEQDVRPDPQGGEAPVFAMLALVSSHAPWTPVLDVLDDPEAMDDGRVFHEQAGAGPAPEVLWRDFDRVRDHYAEAVRYSLEVSGHWARDHVDEDTLFLMPGDHQPAALITGPDPSWAVPVHVISGDPDLLEPFRARGFHDGFELPPATGDEDIPGFEDLRDWLHEDYTERP